MKKTKEQKRTEKYSKKPIDQFSPILPWIYLPFRPKTFKKAWRLINSVLSQFFFLQTFQALHLTHRPVIYVDTELDEKIPFVPEHVKTYMSFIPFFIKPISMLIKRCGYRNSAPYINVFLKFLATQYHNASSIYKFCMTTTHRPDYKKSKEFRTIHAADPHLLCVPSLHVTIAAGTYAWFKQFFQTDLLPKEEAEMRLEEIHQQALKITESVLFVKQHSVNCIPLALYMLTSTMNKSFFSIQDADDFMSELFRNSSESADGLKKFLSVYKIPVVTSLMGLGCIPESSEEFIGMVGMHGSYAANVAMYESDLVIAAGVRFDDRATGIVAKFCPNARIVHIDVDAAEINKIMDALVSIVADVESVFPAIAQLASENKVKADESWLKKIINVKKETDSINCGRPSGEKLVNPREFIARVPELSAKAGIPADDIIVTTDVGQHQMWAAQYYPIEKPRTFLTSGSLGTMGFGLPAAIGASLANPEKRIVCFSGDGSIMMNIQEMATLAELNLPVTVIVFQNGTLGMVYQQQKYLFEKNYSASIFGKEPDLLAIAAGFGIETVDADSDPEWYRKAFDAKRQNKPCFVRCSIDSEENVLPFVPGGKANIDSIRD